jgi:hypothetical protein
LKIFYAPSYIKIFLLKFLISDLNFEPWAKSPSSMVERLISDRLSEIYPDNNDNECYKLYGFNISNEHKYLIDDFLSKKINIAIKDNFDFSNDEYNTLITIFDLHKFPENLYGFYLLGSINRNSIKTILIPPSQFKYFEVNNPSNKVSIFEQQDRFTEKIDDQLNSPNTIDGDYIYIKRNNMLLKPRGSIDVDLVNKILFVKMNSDYVHYDPQIPNMANRDLFIKDKSGVYHDLKIKTATRLTLTSSSHITLNKYEDLQFFQKNSGRVKSKNYYLEDNLHSELMKKIFHLKRLGSQSMFNSRFE